MWALAHRFALLPDQGWMNYAFFDFIPACVALLMATSGSRPRRFRLILGMTLFVPLAFVAWRLARGRLFVDDHQVDDGLCLLALLLWWWRPSARVFARLAPVGAISYAIYIFHRPLQEIVTRQSWLPSGNVATFVLRCIVILVVTGAISWFGERRFQPWLRRHWSSVRATSKVSLGRSN